MYWASLSDFLAMGGHGGFVWPAFGAALLILLALGLHSRLQMKMAEREHAQARAESHREAGREA